MFCKHCSSQISEDRAVIVKPYAEEEEFPPWVSTEADKKLFAAARLYDAPPLILADYSITIKYLERAIQMEKEREQGRIEAENIARLVLLLEEPICFPFTYLFCGEFSEPSPPNNGWCVSYPEWLRRDAHLD